MNLRIQIDENASPLLQRLNQTLSDRSELNKYLAGGQEALWREHVLAVAPSRHATADRLGARRTGHLERASQLIEARGATNGVDITFPRSTGLQRAFGPITITPRNSRYLTLPVHPLAYGRRAGEFAELFALRVGLRGTLVLARRIRGSKQLETLYLLVKKVEQPQDRGLEV